MNAPNVIIQRKEWINNLPKLDKNKLVFLDESGVNIDMTKIYGRSFGGSRCVDKAPLIKPQSTTILSSVRLNGETAFKTYQGGTACERFTDYLKNVLAPTLEPDDIVVMDNMHTHHSKAVKKVIDELKINVIYLPPYSPDFITFHKNKQTFDKSSIIKMGDDKMLSTEIRELMVKAYEKSHNATEVARNFSVSRSTVYDHVNQMRETGSVAVQTSKRGRKPILSQQQLDKIAETITNQPDISIHEIKEKLALPVSEENIREKVVQMGFVYKKKSLHASKRERSRCGHPAKRMDK